MGFNNPNEGGCLCPLCPHAGALCGCRSGTKGCPLAWAVRGPLQWVTTQCQPPGGRGTRRVQLWGSHGLTYSSMLMGQESGTAAAWQERPEGTW